MSNRGFFYIDGTTYHLMMNIKDEASLDIDITGYNSLCTGGIHHIEAFLIGKNAKVRFSFAGGIVISDRFIIDEAPKYI